MLSYVVNLVLLLGEKKGIGFLQGKGEGPGKKGEGEGKGRNLGDLAGGTHGKLGKEVQTVMWGGLCVVPKGLS